MALLSFGACRFIVKRPLLAMKTSLFAAVSCTLISLPLFAADAPSEFPPQPPIPALSPEEELKTFQLPEGYRMELVLSEKDDVKEPVLCVFDGNGRMYVAEMRSYMQDIDGAHEHDRISRVSRHESTKRDGKFDKHTVFADQLLLPRMVLPLDDRVLINETDTMDIYSYRDTKGDGVADAKEIAFQGGPKGGNLEHQQSGLIWALDNWCYQTTNAYRLRFTGKEVQKEPIPSGGGQWGLCQDDYGKIWWSNAGGEKGLWHFQTPILYGGTDVAGQFPPDFMEVWPLVGLADVQGGKNRFRPDDKTLNHFTGSCGQEIVRVDRVPADFRGNALVCEPVGRLIRRAKVEVKDAITTLTNPHGHSEFLRSTDPNFRPVNITNGPDGCLYIVDMYRGIIQEGNWVREGSYLRKVVQQYSFDKVFGHGRIWRLVHKDFQPGPQPHMLDETPAQLVAHLEHPNGWWRDTAQKLIVLRGDKSVVPALVQMARASQNHLARIHALWTLEGLDALDKDLIREKLKDPHPQVRIAAIRASEPVLKKEKDDTALMADVQELAKDADPSVVLQVLMTGKLLNWPDYAKFAQIVMAASPAKGVRDIGMIVLNGGQVIGGKEFSAAEIEVLRKGEGIYKELCFACHGFDGKGMQMDGLRPGTTIAPPLAGSKDLLGHRDAVAYILLNGMSGPVGSKTYDAQMIAMSMNDDAWIAAVGSYVRNAFGNHGAMIAAADVARIRAATKDRTEPWTANELHTILPHPLANTRDWKVTASHNSEHANLAIDGSIDTRWDTHGFQTPGQWFQIELPEETTIVYIRLDQGKSAGDYPRGYKVEISADGQTWGKPIAQGHGTPGATEIYFAPVKAKFIKITQTGTQQGLFWSIHELQVCEPPKPLAAAKTPVAVGAPGVIGAQPTRK
jgi:putative membrane-bound dehydrogenase-like protein